jgi:hypothetical protein
MIHSPDIYKFLLSSSPPLLFSSLSSPSMHPTHQEYHLTVAPDSHLQAVVPHQHLQILLLHHYYL